MSEAPDIAAVLEQHGLHPMDVTLPRESRRQRSCCVALVAFRSRRDARAAIRRAQGAELRRCRLRLEPADAAPGPEDDSGGEVSNFEEAEREANQSLTLSGAYNALTEEKPDESGLDMEAETENFAAKAVETMKVTEIERAVKAVKAAKAMGNT